MQRLKSRILIALLFFVPFFIGAQDIHWSQFYDNPIFQNPGNAGNFKGDFRFVGNHRDQWRNVSVPFQTTSISLDGRLKKAKNLGLGGLIFHDVVGDGQLRTIELQLNANIPLYLNQDSTFSFRPGFNFGMNQRQLNANSYYFDNQFDGSQLDLSLPSNEIFATSNRTNVSTGLGFVSDYNFGKKNNFNFGAGFYNLNRPNQGFFGTKIQRDVRSNFHARLTKQLKKTMYLMPAFNIALQGKYKEIVLGTSIKYVVKEYLGQYRALHAGIWYRAKDATFLTLGLDYQNWFFGVSYDMNISKLTQASNVRGGLEIAVRYIHLSLKPKKIHHRVCPDFI